MKIANYLIVTALAFNAIQLSHAQEGPPTATVVVKNERTPVQVQGSTFPCDNVSNCAAEVMDVPEGQRLVIEHVGLRTTFIHAPDTVAAVRLQTQFDGQIQSTSIGTTTNTGPGINSVDIFASPVRIYSEAGSKVYCVALAPNFEPFLDIDCTLTGYLEPE